MCLTLYTSTCALPYMQVHALYLISYFYCAVSPYVIYFRSIFAHVIMFTRNFIVIQI
jgi:hypothetical protein